MTYSIVSVCSSDYTKAYDRFVSRWKADRIRIYVDQPLISLPGIELKSTSLNNKWIDNVGSKPHVMLDFWDDCDTDYMIFVDIDCYLKGRLDHLCQPWMDVGLTKRGFDHGDRRVKSRDSLSSGIVCIHKNEYAKQFLYKWIQEQDKMKTEGNIISKVNFCISYNEMSINTVAANLSQNLVIYAFSQVYNLKVADLINKKNVAGVESFLPEAVVLHFYRKSFLRDDFVSDIIHRSGQKIFLGIVKESI